MMRLLLALLCVSYVLADDLGYDESAVFDCKAHYTVQQRMQILTLYPIDRWVYTIISPFTIVGSSVMMALFFSDRKLFGMPGDILFVICFSEFLRACHQFASGLYADIYDLAPDPNGNFCQVNGIIASCSFAINTLYTLAFAAYPLVLFYNSLASTTKMMRIINIVVSICILIPMITVSISSSSISIDLSGLCAISPTTRESSVVIASSYLLMLFSFVVMSLSFIVAFKKLVPKHSPMRSLRGRYLKYYQSFMAWTIGVRLCQCVFQSLDILNCYYILNPYVNISITFNNILTSILALGQLYIISNDPLIKTKLSRYLTGSTKVGSMDGLSLQAFKVEDLVDSKPSGFELNVLEELHSQMKKTQVYSILAGIQMLRVQSMDKCKHYDVETEAPEQTSTTSLSFDESDVQRLSWCKDICFSKEETEECLQVDMTDELVKNTINYIPEMQTFKMKCTLYAPKIFKHFVAIDSIDLEKSFDLILSKEKLEEFAGPDGGKSGEFFYFSYDRKLIIKTMQWSEVVALRKRMILYGNYLANNANSFIAKIYGMYTFERLEMQNSKTHFLIMKNMSLGITRQHVLRIFDMKGSEYDREVIPKLSAEKQQNLGTVTLKDADFFKTEEQVWVSKEQQKEMNKILRCDAMVFKQLRLIDYSLLVIKIDWGHSGIDINAHKDDSCNNIVESCKEPGVYYHIGVIDYLQEWNVNKGMERATKKILQFNSKLDTSAQDPNIYADRFYDKLINRILPAD